MKMLVIAVTSTLLVTGLACQNGAAFEGAAAQSGKPATAKGATSAAELDRLLAPVALYPDQLLAQMLLCAGDPAKVTQLNTWLTANKALTGTELQDAAVVEGFEPQFVSLVLFPQVVDYMTKQLDWTTQLGKAFASNKTGVFDSIQRLRAQAEKSGALKDTPQQQVDTKKTSSGQDVIVIEPANPQVIYVPQYNPTVVYTQPATTTVVVQDDDDSDAVVAGLIGFTAGIAIGAAIDNDYYYGPWGWGGGAYMYNDAWDDWYDAREDAREDWVDHREDLVEERGERREDTREQRTERTDSRQEGRTDRTESRAENRPDSGTRQVQQRTPSTSTATAQGTSTAATQRSSGSGYTARGHSSGTSQQSSTARSGTKSDAFSGYSSGRSERAASTRGASSRGASRAGGGGGGGRRR